MSVTKGSVIFYGLDGLDKKVNDIIEVLDLKRQSFEVKLIIFEAVNNAYIHGNGSDSSKPIYVDWELKDNLLSVIVKDCGQGFENINLHKKIDEENILDESGRGLYIISCYTDELILDGSSIIMRKSLLCDI
ncbi:serine/threonine-protein kinase RsbW [Clostridium beijerinckii]|uniref:ATP-binding protein n=1 Tax=Clostridium beijerinckii TaxID=1520 RepID=UPI0014944C46|nr:ATP-binding protein [Clostridium beijerinckii]NOW88101.1 serine/threonine-protein kinase RsbW [Clostridium beijerinckii]